jgi:hypothetical protein
MLKAVVNFLKNKKSYIISGLTVLYGLYEGFVVTGGNYKTFVPYLISGAGLSALKAAVVKAGTPTVYSVPK